MDNLLFWIGVYLIIKKWLKQTLCVSYFTKILSGCFTFLPVNKANTMCWIFYWVHLGYICLVLDLLQNKLRAHSVIEQWFKKTRCVSYFTKCIFTCEHIRHCVLDILRIIIWVNLLIDQLLKQTQCVSSFTDHTFIITSNINVMTDV